MSNKQCATTRNVSPEMADSAFETTDFYLGCFLKAHGFALSDVRRKDGRATFVFRDRPERRELILGFYNNEGAISPLALVSAIKDMKAIVHNT